MGSTDPGKFLKMCKCSIFETLQCYLFQTNTTTRHCNVVVLLEGPQERAEPVYEGEAFAQVLLDGLQRGYFINRAISGR